MFRKNLTKEKLQKDETVIGVRLDFTSPHLVESLGGIGFDFVYFDLEHAPMSEESCLEMIRAAELAGLTPLARVPAHSPGITQRLLDIGVMGVIMPHCNTKPEAQAAVEAVKYPPQGKRGIAGRSLDLSGLPLADYIREANKETMVIAMIEEVEALDNLSQILTVASLDVLLIGRLDLSISMGIPGKINDPALQSAVNRIITEGCAAGKVVGVGAISVDDPNSVRNFIKQGARFFPLGATSILKSASRDLLKKIKLASD